MAGRVLAMFCSAAGERESSPGLTIPTGLAGAGGVGGGLELDSGLGGGVSNMCPGSVQSFIWIANTGEGTLSKVCTSTAEEVARYTTSPQLAAGDPSRTSVNLHGDMVVTNRDPTGGPSSVTKFAGDINDCVDRNADGHIDSSSGPSDVRPWGEEECMVWNTPLGNNAIGARATAWDGMEDPDTGLGGHVYIGAMTNKTVYQLDGDTGEILQQAVTALSHYGGAIDNQRNFWTVAMTCTIGACQIERTSLDDLSSHDTYPVHCGYGISVDGQGRVWTAGQNLTGGGGCVSRYDPATGENVWVNTGATDFNRGVAVGIAASAGSAWAASTNGDLIQVDLETVQIVQRQPVGVESMVGVAVDYEGYVWTVSEGANAAHRVDPTSWAITTVPIGLQPYTYSDMTGMQLWGAVGPPR
jgi:hypothetical protein